MSARSRKASKVSYNKCKGSSARTFIRDRAPFWLRRVIHNTPLSLFLKALDLFAGAMLYVVVEELIPEMSQGQNSNVGTVLFRWASA